jgi:pimeloyl-ACP methyl ester carboxylesterase
MPSAVVNGINLNYDDYGSGDLVVLVTGSGAPGRLWRPCQVPALTAAGYRVITVDNRGVPPTDRCPGGFTVEDMARDISGLIAWLDVSPCRIVGFSLGGIIVQEMLLMEPGLVTQAVLIATRGRTDALRAAGSAADAELLDSGIILPPKYDAVMRAIRYLSPRTLNDDQKVRDWLDVFEMSPQDIDIRRAHQGLDDIGNRLKEYHGINCPCLVLAFCDDLVIPPYLCREVAEYIPGCAYREIPDCGHYGYLENPEAVNSAIIDFFKQG